MPSQILGPALDGPAAMEAEESDAAPALDASSSQAAEQGSRRPVSGEKAFLLTVAQRAKEAAAAGAVFRERHLMPAPCSTRRP